MGTDTQVFVISREDVEEYADDLVLHMTKEQLDMVCENIPEECAEKFWDSVEEAMIDIQERYPSDLDVAITPLEKEVQRIINEQTKDGYSVRSFMEDLQEGGCESGLVGCLVYYSDTLEFYSRHGKAISDLLGAVSPSEALGDKWDAEDPLAADTNNQNLLAWFGFEETAFDLAERIGIEL